jgi:hypothetical protein
MLDFAVDVHLEAHKPAALSVNVLDDVIVPRLPCQVNTGFIVTGSVTYTISYEQFGIFIIIVIQLNVKLAKKTSVQKLPIFADFKLSSTCKRQKTFLMILSVVPKID